MKKNILFIILFFLFGFVPIVRAQEGVTDCGKLELEGDSLEDNVNLALSSELTCLGEQILTKDSSAKVHFTTDSFGEMEFYIERGEDSTFVGKVTMGAAENMASENQVYANTFYVCPSSIDEISAQAPDINFEERPGSLALWAYLQISEKTSDPVNNNCVGTYFTVDVDSGTEEGTGDSTDEKNKDEQISEEIVEQDFSVDKRKLFSEIMDEDKISNIESNTGLTVSEKVKGCKEDDNELQNQCVYYFSGEERDQFDNPTVNLSVSLFKQNKKVNNSFSLYQSLLESVNFYNSISDNYKSSGYLDNSDQIEIKDLGKDYYSLFELSNKRLVILKDSWVLEIDFTQGVDIEYVTSLAGEIVSEIDDLRGIDISKLKAFDESMKEKESSVEEKQTSELTEESDNLESKSLLNRLRGKIILKVEEKGEAYYINPADSKMYYLGRPEDAFQVMREQGIGITTSNLKKIPIGLTDLSGPDDDGDGLSNMFEDAMSTDKFNSDMDGDSYSDKDEIVSGYSPYGAGKLIYDSNFAKQQLGKIFLQVENNGEAWYVNPGDSKRYFLGRPADAFNIMRTLGLGISNNDFASLEMVAN